MNGTIFKKNRLKLGLTQAKIAPLVGLSKRQIINIEKSDNKIKSIYAEKVSELLCLKDNPLPLHVIEKLENHISDKEIEILDAYRGLPRERQELFYYKLKAEAIEYKTDELKAV